MVIVAEDLNKLKLALMLWDLLLAPLLLNSFRSDTSSVLAQTGICFLRSSATITTKITNSQKLIASLSSFDAGGWLGLFDPEVLRGQAEEFGQPRLFLLLFCVD